MCVCVCVCVFVCLLLLSREMSDKLHLIIRIKSRYPYKQGISTLKII